MRAFPSIRFDLTMTNRTIEAEAQPCTGCGQETACAYQDGDRKARLCPECLEWMRRGPGAREVLLAEVPTRVN